METNRPPQRISASFEYFLYAAIIAETGLAAFIYKTIFRDADLVRLNIYFGFFYLAFLAWSVAQLHKLHRRRKLLESESTPEQASAASPERTPSALGLSSAQLVIVVLVFATAVATFSWALKLLR